MAVNPALVGGPGTAPAPFPGELFLLKREGVCFEVDGLPGAGAAGGGGGSLSGWLSGLLGGGGAAGGDTWRTGGDLYLSNVRAVLVATGAGAGAAREGRAPAAFDMPLVYVRQERFEQPVFGANYLRGNVFAVGERGGPGGEAPPHAWKVEMVTGGCGTLLPVLFDLLQRSRAPGGGEEPPPPAPTWDEARDVARAAYVDPRDPSTVYVPDGPPVDRTPRPAVYPVW
mmetsp:Transcript_19769/g.67333  ORF Transcript_19769/g.67333 Transcript_19769/m.67333 type:complete len:227 (-) Transcript_19769:162-842(-)